MSRYGRLEGYQVLLRRAQQHKDNPTSSEEKLLTALASQLPDLDFQFQVVMIPFIVDFVSLTKKVIIEVDGKSHEGNFDSDRTRQRDLERDGYSFIRFSHDEVMTSIDKVLTDLRHFCSLSHSERRRFASPEAEYIRRGMVPRVIGESDPFYGLHSREEIEEILREGDPYDIWEHAQAEFNKSASQSNSIVCLACKQIIQPAEPRFRDHSSLQSVNWIHKRCRR
jgi:very-short-patch-repair endonuclease